MASDSQFDVSVYGLFSDQREQEEVAKKSNGLYFYTNERSDGDCYINKNTKYLSYSIWW